MRTSTLLHAQDAAVAAGCLAQVAREVATYSQDIAVNRADLRARATASYAPEAAGVCARPTRLCPEDLRH
jgi:hypothetical protein